MQNNLHAFDHGGLAADVYSLETENSGIYVYEICFRAAQSPALLEWEMPMLDIAGLWHPCCGMDRGIKADWYSPVKNMTSRSAPVMTFYNSCGFNRCTFSLSEIRKEHRIYAGVHEEDGTLHIRIQIPLDGQQDYRLLLRIDHRELRYCEVLHDVVNWWQKCGVTALPTPESAWEPVYSTWYAWHQEMHGDALVEECRRAATLGMRTIIIDDGWQTADNNRGYSYCGDWRVEPGKFPDLRKTVSQIHKLGMKCMMWFSVPYVGIHAGVWTQFSDKLLTYNPNNGAGVLDPRYPQVREYLIGTYERFLREYELDGMKLDFIDEFHMWPESPAFAEGMDCRDVQTAVNRLMSDVISRLQAIRPEVMIEFRQPYIGPGIWEYGNMFRAEDCPNSELYNRVKTLDLRLLMGSSAVHSDMLMWHPDESAEAVSRQIIACIFSVIQFSVRLDRIDQRKQKMLKWWIGFMEKNRKLLLHSPLEPMEPQNLYPLVVAETGHVGIVALYLANQVVTWKTAWNYGFILNGVGVGEVFFSPEAVGCYRITLRDCCGEAVQDLKLECSAGQICRLPLPAGGCAEIESDIIKVS